MARRESRSTYVRRRVAALVLLLLAGVGVVAAAGAATGDGEEAGGGRAAAVTSGDGDAAGAREDGARAAQEPAAKPPTLPDGTRRLFPDHRLVAFYGNPADPQLGALGIGTPDEAAARLLRVARFYERKTRPVMPVLELIVTVAAAHPGDDGLYRLRTGDDVIRRYLRAARKVKGLLLLDVQPGRSNFPKEVARLRKWLKEPDVGLALDPEWRVQEGQIPGQVIGTVNAAEVDAVSAELARIVKAGNLPEKLFVLHQFTTDMIKDKQSLKIRPGLATVFNVDGFGTPANKISKYDLFTDSTPKGAHDGFKVFFEEDIDRMRPSAVLNLKPPPDIIQYE
jgi:hypothetical protein